MLNQQRRLTDVATAPTYREVYSCALLVEIISATADVVIVW